MATATAPAPQRYMQGIAVPASSVNPGEFFARTNQVDGIEYQRTYAGLGANDVFELRKTGIIYGLILRFAGQVIVTPGGGSVATTARWPYDIVKGLRFTANGQSNLINVSGLKLKAHEVMGRTDMNDRGIAQSVGGATVTQGTLSQSVESWGVGSRATAIPGGTYDIELDWYVPVAEDATDLQGAIFAATSSTDLTLNVDWASSSELFVLAGGGTAVVNGTVTLEVKRCTVPMGADGQIVVPDLSTFHSLIQTSTVDLALGMNEPKLIGQGAGKTLLRMYSQLWNGANPAPLKVDATNFGKLGWRFSGNETPDEYPDGRLLRYLNERMYNSDIGAVWGFWAHDFAVENAFRDAVDLGTTSEFRQLVETKIGLTGGRLETVAETMFVAGS
ncbi:hypothetical protein F9L07_19845 [Pimelobacter simplex]|uniref:P3 N-terminal domain-containing protein n=1 Tax=Nocardioides simplex TaxID=2045 RepID=A0A7J5DVL0_NOCSI|nr:hypothetical protein [Pimelobacter simplex]KAB2809295.1 hypothetical protein F9L07_19845 [Pimelobacter simplex]